MNRVRWGIEGEESRFMGHGGCLAWMARQRAGAMVCAGGDYGVNHSIGRSRLEVLPRNESECTCNCLAL